MTKTKMNCVIKELEKMPIRYIRYWLRACSLIKDLTTDEVKYIIHFFEDRYKDKGLL